MRDDFWASGMTSRNDRKFHWCGIDKPIGNFDTIWMSGHPKESPNDCAYVHIEHFSNSTFTATDLCDAKKNFLCEVYILYFNSTNSFSKKFIPIIFSIFALIVIIIAFVFTVCTIKLINAQSKPTGPDAMTLQQECAEIWKINGSICQPF
jgi:hypothetical protein